MEIEIIEAGALISLPGGHEDRQRILRILHGIYAKCRFDVRKVRGGVLVRCPERYAADWPALQSALDDHKRQMSMF